jgi:hypothetical protein
MVKSKRMGWVGHILCMWETRNAYKVSVGKPEAKRSLGRLWRLREDGMKNGYRRKLVQNGVRRWDFV